MPIRNKEVNEYLSYNSITKILRIPHDALSEASIIKANRRLNIGYVILDA